MNHLFCQAFFRVVMHNSLFLYGIQCIFQKDRIKFLLLFQQELKVFQRHTAEGSGGIFHQRAEKILFFLLKG